MKSFNLALKGIKKQRFYVFLNLIGVVVGFTTAFCMLLFIISEYSFDRNQANPENSYRLLNITINKESEKISNAINLLNISAILTNQIPEIKEIVNIKKVSKSTVKLDDRVFVEDNLLLADASLINVFSIEMLSGSLNNDSFGHEAIFLSESRSKKYFGSVNSLDRVIYIDSEPKVVKGIFKDNGADSHLEFSMIGSNPKLQDLNQPWMNQGYIYLVLEENADPLHVEHVLNTVLKNKVDWLAEAPEYKLQRITDIHLNSNNILGVTSQSDKLYILMSLIIGLIVLVSTAVNFVNLTVIYFLKRSRSLGIQKTLGASSRNIFSLVSLEILMVYVSGVFLSLLATFFLSPILFSSLHVKFDVYNIFSLEFLICTTIVTSLIYTISLLYPYLCISQSKAQTLIKSRQAVRGMLYRKSLLIFQFLVAIFILTTLFVVKRQMDFVGNQNLGFVKESVLVLKTPQFSELNLNALKNSLSTISGVISVSSAYGTPFGGGMQTINENFGNPIKISEITADENFVSTLQMEVIDGRDFIVNDSNKVLVNESFVDEFKLNEAIGYKFNGLMGNELEVVGVVKNFQLNEAHSPFRPVAIEYGNLQNNTILLRYQENNEKDVVDLIQKTWSKIEPNHVLELNFLNDQFNKVFQSQIQFEQMSKSFAVISFVVCCLGMFTLTIYTLNLRKKEIAIRKVMGSTTSQVVRLLLFNFLNPLLISFGLSIPISLILLNMWLRNFSYHIQIDWTIFATVGFIALLIGLLTVFFQSLYAGSRKAVEALKEE